MVVSTMRMSVTMVVIVSTMCVTVIVGMTVVLMMSLICLSGVLEGRIGLLVSPVSMTMAMSAMGMTVSTVARVDLIKVRGSYESQRQEKNRPSSGDHH